MFKEDYIKLFELSEKHDVDFETIYDIYHNAIDKLSESFMYAAPQEVGFAKVNLFLESISNTPIPGKAKKTGSLASTKARSTAAKPAITKTKTTPADGGALAHLALVAASHPDNEHLAGAVAHLKSTHPDIAGAIQTGMKSKLAAHSKVVSKPQKQAVNLTREREKRVKEATDKIHKQEFDKDVDTHSKAVTSGEFNKTQSAGSGMGSSMAIKKEYNIHKKDLAAEIAGINSIKGKKRKEASDAFLKKNDHFIHLIARDHNVASTKDTDLRDIDKRSKTTFNLKNKKDTIEPIKQGGIKSAATSFVHKEAAKIHSERKQKGNNQNTNNIQLAVSAEKNAAEKQRQSDHAHAQRETKQILTKRAQDIQKRKGIVGKVKKMIGFKDKPRTV